MQVMRLGMLALALAASGCANVAATNIQKSLAPGGTIKQPSAVFIDAKQRAIFTGAVDDVSTGKTKSIVCPEPSPDVFSAIAARAGLSVQGLSKGIAAEGGMNEAAASIGLRTQTITLLRDSNFQPCLSRMNGSDQVQYDMMMRRSQNNIAGLLAIEQLTGAVRGPAGTAGATSGKVDLKSLYTAEAQAAQAVKDDADDEGDELKKQADDLGAEDTACKQEATDKPNDKPSDTCTDDAKTKRKAKLADLKKQMSAAKDKSDNADKSSKKFTDLAAKTPEGDEGSTTQGSTPGPDAKGGETVAGAVKEIALSMINHDYTLQMCFDYSRSGSFGNTAASPDTTMVANAKVFCQQVLDSTKVQITAQANVADAVATPLKTILDKIATDGKATEDQRAAVEWLLKIAVGISSPAIEVKPLGIMNAHSGTVTPG